LGLTNVRGSFICLNQCRQAFGSKFLQNGRQDRQQTFVVDATGSIAMAAKKKPVKKAATKKKKK